jgi:hypothetical protein
MNVLSDASLLPERVHGAGWRLLLVIGRNAIKNVTLRQERRSKMVFTASFDS